VNYKYPKNPTKKLFEEVWKEDKYSEKADIWSFGCIVYQLVMMRRPFNSESLLGNSLVFLLIFYPKKRLSI
jgi:serine/threonine protein kinase